MDLGSSLFQLLEDPTVAYLLLVVGLWMLVIAVTTPGTGFAEVTAAIFLVLAAVGLFTVPINLGGLLLMLLAFVLFAVDVFAPTHGALTVGGVVSLLFGSLLLFPQRAAGGGVSAWLVGGVTAASGAVAGLALHGLIRSLRQRRVDLAAQTVEGAEGFVRHAIPPGGTGAVQVSGQLWTAEADEPIGAGTRVVVKGRTGLTLRVSRAAPKQPA